MTKIKGTNVKKEMNKYDKGRKRKKRNENTNEKKHRRKEKKEKERKKPVNDETKKERE